MSISKEKINPPVYPNVNSFIGLIYPTPFIRRACGLVESVRAVKNSRIGWLNGEPGSGKTAASYYLEEVCNCHRICCSGGLSPLGLLREIARSLDVSSSGSYEVVLRTIKKNLLEIDGATFVIDEADELSQRGLNALRYLADEARAAIILCGSDILEQIFAHPRSGAYLKRMTSRIGTKKVNLSKLTTEETNEYVLKPIFGEVSQDAIKAFYKTSQGHWRKSMDLVIACQDVLAFQNETKLTPQIIHIAAKTSA